MNPIENMRILLFALMLIAVLGLGACVGMTWLLYMQKRAEKKDVGVFIGGGAA